MKSKAINRKKIHKRIRRRIAGTSVLPRLHVYRSNKSIYASIIDDLNGTTLASARSSEIDEKGTKAEIAKKVGALVAEKAKASGIEKVKFDRGGYLYHGRVKSLADGAREAGLKF